MTAAPGQRSFTSEDGDDLMARGQIALLVHDAGCGR
jgi:hypothetical protein